MTATKAAPRERGLATPAVLVVVVDVVVVGLLVTEMVLFDPDPDPEPEPGEEIPVAVLVLVLVVAVGETEEVDPVSTPTQERLNSGVVVRVDPIIPKLGLGVAGSASCIVYHQVLVFPNRGQPTWSQ